MKEQKSVENYTNNYLTNVIFRIDFPKIQEFDSINPPTVLKERINGKFPVMEKVVTKSVQVELIDKIGTTKHEERFSWKFMDQNNKKIFLIDQEFISFECLDYENFDSFVKDVKLVLGNFMGLYPLDLVKRLGLRYINQINGEKGNPLDWSDLINQNLFSIPMNFITQSDSILRYMTNLEIEEEQYLLRFNFGLFNSEFPNPLARKEFVLDYDCYIEAEIEISEIYQRVEECNKIIYSWFERSIEDELRIKMREKNDKKKI
jgi:uncharacterized protein (TIGR04255 family)